MRTNIKYGFSILLITTAMLTACSSSVRFSSEKKSSTATSNPVSGKYLANPPVMGSVRDIIVREALSWIGTPYCYGGETKECTDCSGFVISVYGRAGIKLPRTALNQYKSARKISIDDALPGDLVFFNTKGSFVSHVGIYLGDGQVIHASTSSGVVRQSMENSYLKENLLGYGTII